MRMAIGKDINVHGIVKDRNCACKLAKTSIELFSDVHENWKDGDMVIGTCQ